MVLFQLQKVKNISVPRLQIYSKGPLSFSASLVYISSCIIIDLQHRHYPVAYTISSLNITVLGPNAMNRNTNTARTLRNLRTSLQGIINPVYRIIFHANQKTRTHLRLRGTGIEKGRSSVSEPL